MLYRGKCIAGKEIDALL